MISGRGLSGQVLPQIASVLDGYRDPAILVDTQYRILAANRAYRDVYAGGRRLWHRHCHEVSHGSAVPCDQAGEHCPLKASRASGTTERVLHVHHTPHGEEHVDVETHPVRDESGQILYFVEVMRQIRLASAHADARGLVGRAPAFNRMLELIDRVAGSEAAVLLLGESGTGKEMVAQAIHGGSARAKGAFVPVECSGLTDSLFESELFGHEKGAFTGAHTRRLGLVESAKGGTLFLDEIGDVPLPLQVKLLRLLETRTYRRVGSAEPQQADFRLITATHRDLKAMMCRGEFREDLYYRLSTFPIPLPALRERREDLPVLVEGLLRRIDPRRQLQVAPAAMGCLEHYEFPGNIRELRNILERASLLADGDSIGVEHLPDECRLGLPEDAPFAMGTDEVLPLEAVEQRYLQSLVGRYASDRKLLAEKLGISERTLYRKLQAIKDAEPSGN